MDAPSGKKLPIFEPEDFPFHQEVRLICSFFPNRNGRSNTDMFMFVQIQSLLWGYNDTWAFAQMVIIDMDTDPVLGSLSSHLGALLPSTQSILARIRTLVEKEKVDLSNCPHSFLDLSWRQAYLCQGS